MSASWFRRTFRTPRVVELGHGRVRIGDGWRGEQPFVVLMPVDVAGIVGTTAGGDINSYQEVMRARDTFIGFKDRDALDSFIDRLCTLRRSYPDLTKPDIADG